MKTKILVGAIAALLYGGVALAQDNKDCPPGYKAVETQSSMSSEQVGEESQAGIETQPGEEGTGGAGKEGVSCEPVKSDMGTGGSGAIEQYPSSEVGEGGSGYQTEPPSEPQVTPPAAPVTPEPATGAFTPTTPIEPQRRESKPDMQGLTVTVGGGVEGYTGALAPEINPGPAYGVQADIRPLKMLGVELGYSGAVNNLDSSLGSNVDGPDLVRNGGQAALTLGLTATAVQPYVLGGIGFSDYNFRGAAAGFDDDVVGNVPVGAGLRAHVGDFTADLRANYNFLFDQEFATGVDSSFNENGRYSGTLNIGGTF